MASQDRGTAQRRSADFAVGDVVAHATWGAGRVTEVDDAKPDVVVEWAGIPPRQMSLELAQRILTKLPPDGIEALLINDPDTARRWTKGFPLKVVAAALRDLGQPSKPAAIQEKLDRRGLLNTKWESWWKRVQPAIKQSSHFRVRSDGTYELRSSVGEVPEEPLAPAEKKKPRVRPDETRVRRLVEQLESGELQVGDLENAETVRAVAKELVRRTNSSEGARRALVGAVSASAVQLRVAVEELAAGRRTGELIEISLQLARKLLEMASQVSSDGKTIGEQVAARAKVLESATRWLAEYGIEAGSGSEFTSAALELAFSVRERGASEWRTDTLESLGKTLVHLLRLYPGAAVEIGRFLVADPSSVRARAEIVREIWAKLPAKERGVERQRVLRATLGGTVEAARAAFAWLVPTEERAAVADELVGQLTVVSDSKAIERLAAVLAEAEPSEDVEVLRSEIWTNFRIAASSEVANRQLAITVLRGWKRELESLRELRESNEADSEGLPATVIDATEMAMRWKLGNERADFREKLKRQEAEKTRLRERLEEAGAELADARKLINTLQAQYRLPEKWAEFRARKEMAEPLARLYQELVIARGDSGDQNWTDWILARLESQLQLQGISKFGNASERGEYDPRLHKYVEGAETGGGLVELRCPGFVWSDPTGAEVVLARAKVIQG